MNGPFLSVTRVSEARIPTQFGDFQLLLYQNSFDEKEHMAIVQGDVQGGGNVLVRVHSECFTGDVLGSKRCDCGEQLEASMRLISEVENGVILYLRQEGRGIGLVDKLKAYQLQDAGYDTVDANLMLGHEADERDYTVAALMLEEMGIESIKLLTNNPAKIEGLEALGVSVLTRQPLIIPPNKDNLFYLQTKAARMRHQLPIDRVDALKQTSS